MSLHGNDAKTCGPEGLSLDSSWQDLVKLHAVGIATVSSVSGYIPFPALSFKPFAEVRVIKNGIIYDDHTPDVANRSGVGAYIERDRLRGIIGTYLYLVTNVPVPTQ